jgi:hypothetical protein
MTQNEILKMLGEQWKDRSSFHFNSFKFPFGENTSFYYNPRQLQFLGSSECPYQNYFIYAQLPDGEIRTLATLKMGILYERDRPRRDNFHPDPVAIGFQLEDYQTRAKSSVAYLASPAAEEIIRNAGKKGYDAHPFYIKGETFLGGFDRYMPFTLGSGLLPVNLEVTPFNAAFFSPELSDPLTPPNSHISSCSFSLKPVLDSRAEDFIRNRR